MIINKIIAIIIKLVIYWGILSDRDDDDDDENDDIEWQSCFFLYLIIFFTDENVGKVSEPGKFDVSKVIVKLCLS